MYRRLRKCSIVTQATTGGGPDGQLLKSNGVASTRAWVANLMIATRVTRDGAPGGRSKRKNGAAPTSDSVASLTIAM